MFSVQLFAVTATGPRPLPLPDQVQHVSDLFDDLPAGVYTALCTFEHNKFLHLQGHIERLEQSMALLGWDYRLDRLSLRRALHEVCTEYPLPNARVRLDVLAEPGVFFGAKSRLLIALSPFEPIPETIYQDGVRVGIARKLNRTQPLVKKATFVPKRRKYLQENPSVYECLILDHDSRILEGTTSNFFGVRDGVLWTAGQGVLEGIARKIVLEVAAELSIPVQLEAIPLDEIARLDESALSSSSRALIPIIQIGDQTIGNGRPGPVTNKLLKAYIIHVAKEIRPAIEASRET